MTPVPSFDSPVYENTVPQALTPVDEHRALLERQVSAAMSRLDMANHELAAWTPVLASCRAALEVLDQQPQQSTVEGGRPYVG